MFAPVSSLPSEPPDQWGRKLEFHHGVWLKFYWQFFFFSLCDYSFYTGISKVWYWECYCISFISMLLMTPVLISVHFIERFYWSRIKVTIFYKALFLWRSWYAFSKRGFGKIFLSLHVRHIFLWEMHSAFIAVGNFSALLSNHFIMPTAFEKQPLCVFTFSFNVAILPSAASLKCIWSGIFSPGYASHVFA